MKKGGGGGGKTGGGQNWQELIDDPILIQKLLKKRNYKVAVGEKRVGDKGRRNKGLTVASKGGGSFLDTLNLPFCIPSQREG